MSYVKSPEIRAKISKTLMGHPANPGSGRPAHPCDFCGEICTRRISAGRGCKLRKRNNYTIRTYGISVHEVNALLSKGCSLCHRPAVHIDHDHNTGRVRGALCLPHNRAIGNLGDTPDAIERALRYVKGEDLDAQSL